MTRIDLMRIRFFQRQKVLGTRYFLVKIKQIKNFN
jgi:hypothetical protein